jgi:tRNA pseudouridine65 synthase
MTRDELAVLYRDDDLVAVDKPAGLLVHRSGIDRFETRFALQLVRDQLGRHVYPVHRLDKPTSGTLLFALNPEAARRLTEAFARRRVRKTYLALVRGFTDGQGLIEYPLKEELDKMTDADADRDKAARTAVTEYRRLGAVELPFAVGRYRNSRYSLIEARPQTGRKHQIRRHLKHIFHPVIGDTTHGEGRHNRFFRSHFDCHRLLLAATELVFAHPFTGREIVVTAPLNGVFATVIEHLGLQASVPARWRYQQQPDSDH